MCGFFFGKNLELTYELYFNYPHYLIPNYSSNIEMLEHIFYGKMHNVGTVGYR